MKGYMAFTRKEFLAFARNYRLMIMLILFMALGFMNPPLAKFMPELINEFVEGFEITLPEITVMDSWTQFFKNVTQLGLIAMVIIFSGIMANELSKGTLINMLTKGLSRKTVILSKFTAVSLLWSLCYFVSFLITLLYNQLFWEYTRIPGLILSILCVWIFGLFLISCLILGGILFKSSYGGLLFTGLIVTGMLVLNMLPALAKYSPIRLISVNMSLLAREIEAGEVFCSLGITCFLAAAIIVLSMIAFHKKKI